MKANKRIRDLRRRSPFRLTAIVDGAKRGVTKYPYDALAEHEPGVWWQKRNNVQIELRERPL